MVYKIQEMVEEWSALIKTNSENILRQNQHDLRDKLAACHGGRDFAEGLYYVNGVVTGEGTLYYLFHYTKNSPDFKDHYLVRKYRAFYKNKEDAIEEIIKRTEKEITSLECSLQTMKESVKNWQESAYDKN